MRTILILIALIALIALPCSATDCYTTDDGFVSCSNAATGQRLNGWNDGGSVSLHDTTGNTYHGWEDSGTVANARTGDRLSVDIPPAPAAAPDFHSQSPQVQTNIGDPYALATAARVIDDYTPPVRHPDTAYQPTQEPARAEQPSAAYSPAGAYLPASSPVYEPVRVTIIDQRHTPASSIAYGLHDLPPNGTMIMLRKASPTAQRPRKPRCNYESTMSDADMAACR